MAKIKIHNLLFICEQVLIYLQVRQKKLSFLPAILATFPEEGVAIPFIVEAGINKDFVTCTFVLAAQDLPWAKAAFQEGLDLSPPEVLRIKKDVVLIIVYGPHLGETPGVLSQMTAELAKLKVEVLAISASWNSSLLVIPTPLLNKARRALNQVLEIPQP